jgi:hypothetical protein
MSSWFWPWIAVVVAIDLLVVLYFISRIRSRSVSVGGRTFDLFSALALIKDSAQELDQTVTEFMRGNFSGDKEQLPRALGGAMDRARSFIAARQIGVDEDVLRGFVTHIVSAHKFGTPAEVAAAMRQVPRPEPTAATG